MALARRNMSLEDALGDAERRYALANPKSRARQDEAGAVMPGGNTRSILFYSPFPLTMTRGQGRASGTWTGTFTPTFWGNTPPGCTATRTR